MPISERRSGQKQVRIVRDIRNGGHGETLFVGWAESSRPTLGIHDLAGGPRRLGPPYRLQSSFDQSSFESFTFWVIKRQRRNNSRQVGAVRPYHEALAHSRSGGGQPSQADAMSQSRAEPGAGDLADRQALVDHLASFLGRFVALERREAHEPRRRAAMLEFL